MTKRFFVALVTAAICILSLLAGSGIGQAYGLYPKTRMIVTVLFVMLPLVQIVVNGEVFQNGLIRSICLVIIIGLWPMYQGNGTMGMEYGWLLLFPYVFGMYPISDKDAKVIGLVCGGFGFSVVFSNLSFGLFDGWNKNDIAMMAFMGSAVCAAAPWKRGLEQILHRAFLIVMAVLVLQLDSRSCFFGIVPLLCLFSFRIINPTVLLRNKWVRRLLLILPAVIAITVVLFQNAPIFDTLNELSIEYFGKPIFNGRNTVWEEGLRLWGQNFLLGTGSISNGHWHNVAITCLTAFGILGYGVWLWYFESILNRASYWYRDGVLSGCTAAFLVIMLQQSFELGLISTTGNMLPYMLLGIILGRMRYLRKVERQSRPKVCSTFA